MITLTGLRGTKKRHIPAENITESGSKMQDHLREIFIRKNAATTAGDNGAINIWVGDNGNIYCESMRYMKTLDFKIFKTTAWAAKWANKWIELIK